MEEIWADIHRFPSYRISTLGNVFNNTTRRMMCTSMTNQGHSSAVKVSLVEGGVRYTRSVKNLVAEAFVKGKTHVFNTPIHLDGNHRNCRADNLVWRPRWFACKYSRQFIEHNIVLKQGPVIDVNTGEIFKDVRECAIRKGLLFNDVYRSMVYKKPIFPDWHNFDFSKKSISSA